MATIAIDRFVQTFRRDFTSVREWHFVNSHERLRISVRLRNRVPDESSDEKPKHTCFGTVAIADVGAGTENRPRAERLTSTNFARLRKKKTNNAIELFFQHVDRFVFKTNVRHDTSGLFPTKPFETFETKSPTKPSAHPSRTSSAVISIFPRGRSNELVAVLQTSRRIFVFLFFNWIFSWIHSLRRFRFENNKEKRSNFDDGRRSQPIAEVITRGGDWRSSRRKGRPSPFVGRAARANGVGHYKSVLSSRT